MSQPTESNASSTPTPDRKLLDKLGRAPLDYSRRRFLWTWLALGLMAILTCFALLLAIRSAEKVNDQTETIALAADTNADEAKEQGDQTVAYLRGEQGIPGVPGANGIDGTPGMPSEPGEPGPKGDQGLPGTQGNSGSAGPLGPTGLAGAAGSTGPAGSNGEPGTAGTEGAQGPKGDRGDEGPRGAEGPPGATGPPGPQGPPGDPHQITTTVAIGQSVKDTSTHKVANAECPAGGRATGGGFAIVPSDPGLIPTASSPVGSTGWSATVDQLSLPPGTEWQVLAFVTCVT